MPLLCLMLLYHTLQILISKTQSVVDFVIPQVAVNAIIGSPTWQASRNEQGLTDLELCSTPLPLSFFTMIYSIHDKRTYMMKSLFYKF